MKMGSETGERFKTNFRAYVFPKSSSSFSAWMLSLCLIAFLALSQSAFGGATYTVTNTDNSGTGSLRWAIGQAAQTGDTVAFDNALAGQTIMLVTPLDIGSKTIVFQAPAGGVTIDGGEDTKIFATSASGNGIDLPAGMIIANGMVSLTTGPQVNGAGIGDGNMSGLHGTVSGNYNEYRNPTGNGAYAYGAGINVDTFSGNLTGELSDNHAYAEDMGFVASARGNSINTVNGDISGVIKNNSATAHSGTGTAEAFAGGLRIYKDITGVVSGTFEGNTTLATTDTGNAYAFGGGLHYDGQSMTGPLVITDATFTNNRVEADSGSGGTAMASGGAIFVDTTWGDVHVVLEPTTTLLFQGNTAVLDGTEAASGIHFGYTSPNNIQFIEDAKLTVKGTGTTNLYDPVIVDMPDSGTPGNSNFVMNKENSGTLNWGGQNIIDAHGGTEITINNGTINLVDGFSLDNGGNNTSSAIDFVFVDGEVKANGEAAFYNTNLWVNNGTLAVADGASLFIDDGSSLVVDPSANLSLGAGSRLGTRGGGKVSSTSIAIGPGQIFDAGGAGSVFTLDATSTLSFNSGIFSVGVETGDASGKAVALNPTTAPTFTGSNTMNISDWILGQYTVLESTAAMNAGSAATFQNFTVGGNAINPNTMSIGVSMGSDNKSLIVAAALNQDSQEKIWGGGSGTWNYINENWTGNGFSINFNPGDAAWFDGTGSTAQNIDIGGDSVALAGMKVSGYVDYTFTGGTLNIDKEHRTGSALDGNEYLSKLIKEGGGTLFLNNGGGNTIAGDVSIRGGILALGNGFGLTNTGLATNPWLVGVGENAAMEVRGGVSLKNMQIQLSYDSSLLFTGGNSSLTIHNESGAATSYLYAGTVDVDLHRDPDLPAIKVTGSGQFNQVNLSLQTGKSTSLLLRHTGLVSQTARWLLVDGAYTGTFGDVTYATATLSGDLRYETDKIYFDGIYTVAGEQFPGFSAMSPNAQNAWTGFRDAFYNHPNAFMLELDQAFSSPADFQAVLPGMLHYASPEGAVTHGLVTLNLHNAFASAAIRSAFPDNGFQIGASGSGQGNQPVSDAGRAILSSRSAYASPCNYGRENGVRIWANYFGNFSRQSDRDRYSGYRADHNGFAIGAAKSLSLALTAGVYGGYYGGNTRYNDIRTRIDTDAGHFGAFVRYANCGFKLTGDLHYSYSDNDSRRTVPTILGDQGMSGSFDQHVFGAGLEFAYDWSPAIDTAMVVTPFLAGRYSHLWQDGYRENGSLPLNVGKTDADSFTSDLGLHVARDFIAGGQTVVTPRLTAGWRRQWADAAVSADANFVGSPVIFAARSVKQSRDALLLGAGVDVLSKYAGNRDLTVSVGCSAEIRRGGSSQNVFASLGVSF